MTKRKKIGDAGHSLAQEHRDKAAECELRATQTDDLDAKARYLDLANSWRLLAEQTELSERR
jgi:hypothetical protein